uniref:Toll-like receptor 1 n=1 Tax=Castor canadensis TaxID=51338 RepID=A0A8B7UD46_CASCN|nr:toll-like receptor 1 [Castor canadensis]XP_020017472.1 toll-like receptor 1 [Castor canadensis]
MTKTDSSIFHFVIIFVLILIKIYISAENELVVDRSKIGLTHIPKDLPMETTTLDMSQNYISELHTQDILLLSKLRILIMSHNRIQYLDISVLKFNTELEYLDLSHNKLGMISCHPTLNFKHLDLSFNAFDALPICKEFDNMSQLQFLGLSATRLQKSDMQPVARLNISKVLLALGDTYGEKEDPESLQVLNTESLHIVFPARKEFHFILDVSASTATSLELSNVKCLLDDECSFINVLLKLQKNPKLSNFTLNNIETTWNFFIGILQLVWHTTIEYFSISNVKLEGQFYSSYFDYSGTSLKTLSIHHVITDVFNFPQSNIYMVFANMNIQNFTVSGTRMVHMLCPSQMSPFLHLDFSNNLLTDTVFESCRHLTKLETLILQMNQLKELVNIIHMTNEMKSLQQLDISQNSLRYDENENNCSWTKSLLHLNMSSNILTDSVFRCLPPKVKVLDLHNNRIQSIPKQITKLESLQELNVAFNALGDLPECGTFSSLSVLIIDHNSISHPSADFFQSCHKIRSIKAGDNPFQCTCELREFVRRIGQVSSEVVEGWPGSYKCEYPESYKGTPLKDFHMSPLSCNTALLIVTIGATMLALTAIVTFLCIYFDLPWYLRMVCQWTQTRHRARNVPLEKLQGTLQYHAFISYSGHDSTWVKSDLLPNLEKEDIRICLHERNFVPGKSIVENIINCIEKSYKSIFVLSPNFVQSEWCHYELYFAHHNLFHEGSNNLILILLEPIPQYSIPSSYHKLKSLMARRTYLEWPKEKSKHGLFWANLRAAINVKLMDQRGEVNHIQN